MYNRSNFIISSFYWLAPLQKLSVVISGNLQSILFNKSPDFFAATEFYHWKKVFFEA